MRNVKLEEEQAEVCTYWKSMFSNEIQIQLYTYDIDISFSYVGNSCRDSPQYRGTGNFFVSQ